MKKTSDLTTAKENPFDVMSDLMMVILIIFLLMIVTLILSVSNHLNIVSKESTYSGGFQRPSLLVDAIRSGGVDHIVTYQLDYEADVLVSADVECKFTPSMFANLLIFIDPGDIGYKNRRLPMLTIRTRSSSNINPNFSKDEIDNSSEPFAERRLTLEDGTSGIVESNIIWDIVKNVWPGYEANDFQIPVSGHFNVVSRPKIYYETSDKNGAKQIIIGHCVIDISGKEIGIFNSLATALTDFVYLGEFNKEERIRFLKEFNGPEAAAYYENWAESGDRLPSPFVKYEESRRMFIRNRRNMNITPPQWVKSEFLDKIGANLKIMGAVKKD
ncbi:MAG: hypothetical protein JRI91_10855 [Deltaproteobacteria bacterium]|nr:hypothetical protein [Deltaproteobacteria bacterium]